MKIRRFVLLYLGQYRKLIIILFFFAMIFAVVFSLYNLEVEAVLYASLLCLAVGLVVLGVDFVLQYNKHQRLMKLCKERFIHSSDLPTPVKLIERDYSELIEILLDNMQKTLNKHDQGRRNMEEYYTLWVHQIKSPVAAIQLILQSEDNPQNLELLLELFKIEQYVEMVLSYIRLDSDTSDFVIKRCSLDGIVRSAVRKYATMFVQKKLSLDFNDVNRYVLTDEKWLTFVVEQVLSNGLKYTASGKISIYVKGETLVIEDSGIGIAAEDLPRVGEKGFTGLNGRYNKKATGIGLFLCKTVCKKLGHSFVIESQAGVGTKVAIGLESAQPIIE